jgi:DNA-binding NarL/FixJ family response regulator
MNEKIKVAFADDHVFVLTLMSDFVQASGDCEVLFKATDGEQVLHYLSKGLVPDVLILDLDMPKLNGYQTALKIRDHYPKTRIVVLSMYHTDTLVIRMLNIGAKAFLKKDCQPEELLLAIKEVMKTGKYFDNLADQLANMLSDPDNLPITRNILTEVEKEFIKFCCTELGYKEIAVKLKMKPHQLEKLREAVFEKMGVRTRVGLVIYAMEHKLVAVI